MEFLAHEKGFKGRISELEYRVSELETEKAGIVRDYEAKIATMKAVHEVKLSTLQAEFEQYKKYTNFE